MEIIHRTPQGLSKNKVAKTCLFPNDNHSDDILTIWHGATTPLTLCGYHYLRYGVNTVINLLSNGFDKQKQTVLR